MIRSTFAAAVAVALSAAPAAAASLSGTYVADTTQLCQAIGNGIVAPVRGGTIEQTAGIITFAGGQATISMTDVWGRAITTGKSIRTQVTTDKVPFTLTGSSDPYTLTMNGYANTAYLGRIDGAGVAHYAVVISGFASTGTGSPNCVTKMVLERK